MRIFSVFTFCIGLSFTASLLPAQSKVDLSAEGLSAWHNATGWDVGGNASLKDSEPTRLSLQSGKGVIDNGPFGRATDLFSKDDFGDCQVHVEFMIARGSNSGVYVMGSYEVQIYDSFGKEKDEYPGIECGGIYGRWIDNKNVEGHSPLVNASKPPGEWQTFDITFRAPRFDAGGKKTANAVMVKVVHNGQLVHENVELTGPTRGGAPERAAGPLRLQGDHGPVAFRNVVVMPTGPTTAPTTQPQEPRTK